MAFLLLRVLCSEKVLLIGNAVIFLKTILITMEYPAMPQYVNNKEIEVLNLEGT